MTGDPPTRLDTALAAMAVAPQDAAARLRFHERLADVELFVLLAGEAEGDRIAPQVFETGEGAFIAAFDREARLAAFAGPASPLAAMPGRALARMAAAEGLGLALNLGVAEGETLVSAETLAWLSDVVAKGTARSENHLREIAPPQSVPETLLTALDAKLAAMPGRAAAAYLCDAIHANGARGHLLAFLDPAEGAQEMLAAAVAETLAFSGLDAAALDVTFVATSEPAADRFARVGLRFDLPPLPAAAMPRPPAPGTDPDRPPILRRPGEGAD